MSRQYDLTVFAALLVFTFAAGAQSSSWEAITNKNRPSCEQPSTCRVIESNGNFEIRFTPEVTGGMKSIKSLEIKNLADGKTQTFKLEEMNDIDQDEIFELYKVQVRPGSKEADLALWAYNSAREDKVFYYFLYDTAKKQFVMSEGTFPKLKYDAKAKVYTSEIQGNKFALGADLKFTPKK